jgi:nucleoside-diphosphate-sugar epimerase
VNILLFEMEIGMSNVQHVVAGAGVLGRGVADLLASRGIRAKVLSRSGTKADGWDSAVCDLRDPRQLAEHLSGPTTLYVCVAPAYWLWKKEFPAIADGFASACSGKDVDIVYADNLYALGQSSTAYTEDSPYRPCSVKGSVRQNVAERLMALNGLGSLRTTIIRAADFFGPGVEQSSVGNAVIGAALSGKSAYVVGSADVAHAITYLPDFAQAMVTLSMQDRAYGSIWHAPSHNPSSLRWLIEQIAARGAHPARVSVAGPLMMRMIGLFNPAMRELREMLYMFDRPCLMSSERTCAEFGLAATDIDTAIDATVAAYRASSPKR